MVGSALLVLSVWLAKLQCSMLVKFQQQHFHGLRFTGLAGANLQHCANRLRVTRASARTAFGSRPCKRYAFKQTYEFMNIFLDTNVVLTGALNPYGPARNLLKLTKDVTFYTSQRVMQECRWLLEKKTDNQQKQDFVLSQIDGYLSKLNAILVEDEPESKNATCHDVDDQYIFDSAVKYNCKYISTYNVRDFPTDEVKAKTPHFILHEIDDQNIDNYIQLPLLNKHGTMIFIGQLHHKSSMGNILRSDSGIRVFSDHNGKICIKGESVKNVCQLDALEGNKEQVLSFRYNSGNFEAARWSYDGAAWNKQVVTRANCSFSEETSPLLFFCPNHNFFGHVKNVSGIPRYVKDKHMQHVLSNKSLETATGSLDLKYVLDNTKIVNTLSGTRVEYPVRSK